MEESQPLIDCSLSPIPVASARTVAVAGGEINFGYEEDEPAVNFATEAHDGEHLNSSLIEDRQRHNTSTPLAESTFSYFQPDVIVDPHTDLSVASHRNTQASRFLVSPPGFRSAAGFVGGAHQHGESILANVSQLPFEEWRQAQQDPMSYSFDTPEPVYAARVPIPPSERELKVRYLSPKKRPSVSVEQFKWQLQNQQSQQSQPPGQIPFRVFKTDNRLLTNRQKKSIPLPIFYTANRFVPPTSVAASVNTYAVTWPQTPNTTPFPFPFPYPIPKPIPIYTPSQGFSNIGLYGVPQSVYMMSEHAATASAPIASVNEPIGEGVFSAQHLAWDPINPSYPSAFSAAVNRAADQGSISLRKRSAYALPPQQRKPKTRCDQLNGNGFTLVETIEALESSDPELPIPTADYYQVSQLRTAIEQENRVVKFYDLPRDQDVGPKGCGVRERSRLFPPHLTNLSRLRPAMIEPFTDSQGREIQRTRTGLHVSTRDHLSVLRMKYRDTFHPRVGQWESKILLLERNLAEWMKCDDAYLLWLHDSMLAFLLDRGMIDVSPTVSQRYTVVLYASGIDPHTTAFTSEFFESPEAARFHCRAFAKWMERSGSQWLVEEYWNSREHAYGTQANGGELVPYSQTLWVYFRVLAGLLFCLSVKWPVEDHMRVKKVYFTHAGSRVSEEFARCNPLSIGRAVWRFRF